MLPGAPGTWGSLATCLLLFPFLMAAGDRMAVWTIILLAGAVLFSILCVAIGKYAMEDFGDEDPKSFVLDEAAGICLTMLLLPPAQGWKLVLTLATAFLVFRIYDVTKPQPARSLERLPAGWGILCDDLAAAVYANLVCQLLLRVIFLWLL